MNPHTFIDIRLSIENKIGRIVINRPEKLNAIRIQTYREIIAALQHADNSDDCHLIVLEGEGGQFTAGNDLADLVDGDADQVMQCVEGIFNTVDQLKKVLICVVEGVAVGIGTTLLLHCDIAVASTSAKFRLPFVNLGVCPEGGASTLLPQAIGQKAARELLLTGRFFSAQEAYSWGLITAITEPEKIRKKVEEYISSILQQPQSSLTATKELMRQSKGDVGNAVTRELQMFAKLLQSEQTRNRITALLKR